MNVSLTPEQLVASILGMQAQINDYKAWDEARRMIIDYLTKHHGLTDRYQWAFKTIEIFQEYEKLKANEVKQEAP